MQLETISFVLGGLLILIGLLGGGFEIKELRIPKVNTFARLLASILGLSFICIAIWIHVAPVGPPTPNVLPSSRQQQTIVPSSQEQVLPRKESEPSVFEKVIGTWKGGPVIYRKTGRRVFELYTFKDNGILEEALVDEAGNEVEKGGWGQFAISSGEIKIYWSSGAEETVRVTWIDSKTFRGETIAHTDKRQVGIDIMFRKLPNKPSKGYCQVNN